VTFPGNFWIDNQPRLSGRTSGRLADTARVTGSFEEITNTTGYGNYGMILRHQR